MRVHPDPEPDAKVWDPVVLQPGYYTAETLPMIPVADGDPVTVRFASQGGYVIFAGARAQGLDPGPARIDSALIDPDTGLALVFDARVVELIPSADGSGAVEPDFQASTNFSHLLPCPNYGARPVTTADWTLSVKLADPKVEARSGSASIRVKPTCAPGSRYLNCVCSCEPNYYLGKCGAEH